MPRAEDYEQAANALEAAAQEASLMMESARASLGSGVMVGGQLSQLVTEELDAAAGILDSTSAELTQLAATCRERAEICRQAFDDAQSYSVSYVDYQTELHEWQTDGAKGHAPDPPEPPQTPPAWANQ